MLDANTKEALDKVSGAIDEKINSRFDEIEVNAKKSSLFKTQKETVQSFIKKGLTANKRNPQKFEIKAGELFTS